MTESAGWAAATPSTDAAGWAAAAIALLAAGIAFWQAIAAKQQAQSAREQAQAARDQVTLAERQADAAEKQLIAATEQAEEAKRSANSAQQQLELLREQHQQQEAKEAWQRRREAYNGLIELVKAAEMAVRPLEAIADAITAGLSADSSRQDLSVARSHIREVWDSEFIPVKRDAGPYQQPAEELYRRVREASRELDRKLGAGKPPSDITHWAWNTSQWISEKSHQLRRDSYAWLQQLDHEAASSDTSQRQLAKVNQQ